MRKKKEAKKDDGVISRKEILEAKLEEVKNRMLLRREILEENTESGVDEAEFSATQVVMNIATNNLNRDVQMLRLVRDALRKLDTREDCVCQRCDEKIPPNRIKAVPWAAYCTPCQEIEDRSMRDGGDDYGLAAAATA